MNDQTKDDLKEQPAGTELSQAKEGQLVDMPAKKNLMTSAKDFLGNTFGAFKGQDVSTLVEEFTSDTTVVIEGLSEDQARIARQTDKVDARQTEFEQKTLDNFHDVQVDIGDTNKKIADLTKQLSELNTRLGKAEKQAQEKKVKKVEGMTGLLRQATWLVGILAGAWIVVTIINFFK